MGTQKTAEEKIKTVGSFAKEILKLAEEKELTVAEVLILPTTLKNLIHNTLPGKEEPYKTEKSQE